MTGRELLEKLEELCPLDAAVEWDNAGFLIGEPDREVKRLCLALDATGPIIDEAIEEGADLILTHHPLLFRAVKTIRADDFLGGRILKLARHRISLISLHTNFDVCVMAELAADKLELTNREILEVTGERNGKPEGIGRAGLLPKEMTLEELAEYVKRKLELPFVTITGDKGRKIRKAAISTGAGKSHIDFCPALGAQVLITGDIDHHTAVDALEKGICLIDGGHFGTEKMFVPYMEDYLKKQLPEIEFFAAHMVSPLIVIDGKER